MKWLSSISILAFILSCYSSLKKEKQSDLDECALEAYNIYHCDYNTYAEWKIAYMDHISFCITDSNTVIKLARIDSEREDYTFFIYGMIERTEPFNSIYNKYPISFHCPGCVSSDMGEIYNREMKKYLMINEGLNYDSIYYAENKKYKDPDDEI